jgi:anti-sigma factor RsiW
MTEHFDEQISEFIDDEMSPEQCEFFVRRLQKDDEARARYMRYQLIGAAVRGEHIQRNASELRRRLQAALAADASASTAKKQAGAGHQLIASAGIAAGFVLFAAIGWGVAMFDRLPPVSASEYSAAAADSPSMVAMPSSDTGIYAGKPVQTTGVQLFVHHAGYSSGFNRTPMLSSLLAVPEDEVVAASQGHSR